MAFRKDIEDERGHITGYWEIEQVIWLRTPQRRMVTVLGYKNKAAKLAGKSAEVVNEELSSSPNNMTLNEIEAAVMASPKFAGAVID